jgi:hypothetical protein
MTATHAHPSIPTRNRRRRCAWCPALCVCILVTASAAAAEPAITAGSYAIESQMVLPHMEEMRRIVKNVDACVDDGNAARLFPVFHQPALTGCMLVPQGSSIDTVDFKLDCQGINGAQGTAQLSFGDDHITGELVAKMGGKNMTFSQYVDARRTGSCVVP